MHVNGRLFYQVWVNYNLLFFSLPETDFMHEIIEVPVVLVSTATAEIVWNV